MPPSLDLSTLGVWTANAERLVPRGHVDWVRGPLGFAGSIAGKPVTTVHKSGKQWVARITGWQWHVTPGMGVARFNRVPGDKIVMTPVKAFETSKSAQNEIQQILNQ